MRVCLYVKVLQLHAVDCDEGVNAEVKYSVDKPSYFAVNSSTGLVTVWNRLDLSSTTDHVLRVTGDGKHVGGMFHCGGYIRGMFHHRKMHRGYVSFWENTSGVCFIMAV